VGQPASAIRDRNANACDDECRFSTSSRRRNPDSWNIRRRINLTGLAGSCRSLNK
jgi:hypothetical protein